MESPQTSKRKIQEGSDPSLVKVYCTPKHKKTVVLSEEQFSLYQLHKESSPNFRAGQDVLEVGWGDSPEPLNLEPKYDVSRTPVTCKKLETKESPKSSIPVKRRNVRSIFSLISKDSIDISKYVAEVEELSKNVLKEFSAQNCNKLVPDSKSIETMDRLSPVQSSLIQNSEKNHVECNNHKIDPVLDNLLETFINEEDEWLSLALSSQEARRIPHKTNFVKSKSENELTLRPVSDPNLKSLTQTCRNINNNFRRTLSLDVSTTSTGLSEKGKGCDSGNRYSLQEIERKRLEAKYRKERREIEKKKMEALRKLEMKKLRAIKT